MTTTFEQSFTLTVSKSGSGSGTVSADSSGVSCGPACEEAYLSSRSGSGGGTVSADPLGITCGPACDQDEQDYQSGTMVTLTATADSGSIFESWSGACSGTGSCEITMDENKTATATFLKIFTLTVSKAGSGSGTVSSSPAGISCGSACDQDYEIGTTVTLTATAESDSTFEGWSGACSGTGTCLVTMNADKAVTATFSQETSGTLTGIWQGPYTFAVNLQGLCQPGFTLTHSGTLTLTLSQSGTSFSGSGTVTGVKDIGFDGNFDCFVVSTQTFGGSISGTLSGQSVTGQLSFSNPDLGVISFSGTLSGNSISGGTLTSPDGSGTFSATKQ